MADPVYGYDTDILKSKKFPKKQLILSLKKQTITEVLVLKTIKNEEKSNNS